MSSIQEEEQPEVEEAGPSSQNKAKTEPELIWKKAVKKGKELMNELLIALKEEKDRKVVKSIFDLKRDHWDIKSPRKESKEFNNLKKIFTDFPDKPDGKELTIISAVRSPTVRLREQTAVYEFAVDKNGYFFIAVNSHKAKNEPTHWSEVAFSVWHHRFPDPSALKYVVRHNIMNTDTQAIIQKAYKDIKLGITEDPHVWEKGTNAFYALLGTVNGKGVVRMLTDYSNSLGRKTIGSIFTAQSRDGQFHMILDVIRASSEVKFHPDNPSGAASAAANPGSSSQNPTIAGPSTASPKTQKSSVPGTMKASSRARMDPAPRLRRSEGQILHRFKPQILRRSRARVLQSR
ncbi:hypothetical protein MMC30_003947 [Trapelia coarctata]|nr:hypothetical protein [Trapelia coarctata]